MININQDACVACGICGDVCPRHIPVTDKKHHEMKTQIAQERLILCMECGHCVAVCPNNAIHLDSLVEADFDLIKKIDIQDHQLLSLMRQRRSVRRYKEKSVPREMINQLIEAAGAAPTGSGRDTTGVIVIDDSESLAEFSRLAYEFYQGLQKNLQNPVARFFVKKRVGDKKLKMLRNFVMPSMSWYIRWYEEGQSNEILRDCPALMLFHSPVDEPVGAENCLIAAFHAIMMAEVIKIGSCFNDLIPPACNRVSEIKELIGLDDGREIYAGVTIGFPKYKFKRVPPRKLSDVRYLKN